MKKTAFFTVVYPSVEPFLSDFFRSLEEQSCSDFDLVIANDGLTTLDLSPYRLNATVLDLSGSPATVRSAAFQYLRSQKYEKVIFGDSDDFFSCRRIEIAVNLLDKYDLIVNELDLVDLDGTLIQPDYLSSRLSEGDTFSAEDVRDKNVFGLSNTALKGEYLPREPMPADLIAVDWFLFASILERGASNYFSSTVKTFYRQHGENTAGLGRQDSKKVLNAVKVKALHYKAMSDSGISGFEELASGYSDLHKSLMERKSFLQDYCEYVKNKASHPPLWWEDAVLPEE